CRSLSVSVLNHQWVVTFLILSIAHQLCNVGPAVNRFGECGVADLEPALFEELPSQALIEAAGGVVLLEAQQHRVEPGLREPGRKRADQLASYSLPLVRL